MSKGKPQEASEMLQKIVDFATNTELDFKSAPLNEVDDYLARHQLDYRSSIDKIQGLIRREQGEIRLAAARERRLRLNEQLDSLPQRVEVLRSSLLQQISSLVGKDTAQAYARKFEENPTEDLRSLLEDFEHIDRLDFED